MAPFVAKLFDNKMPVSPATHQDSSLAAALQHSAAIRSAFEDREFGKAVRLTMDVADVVNGEIDRYKPWILAKDATTNPQNKQQLAEICASALATFKALTLFLKPILPALAVEAESYLRCPPLQWTDLDQGVRPEQFLPAGHEFGTFKPLITRVDPKQLDALFDTINDAAAPAVAAPARPAPKPAAVEIAAAPPEITVDDFAKVDLRIARIVNAELVEGADKLLKLTLDVGEAQRTVFAGIRSAYRPERLIGRLTVVLANLKPRKMKFGVSEGMVLAAGPGGEEIFLLSPDNGAAPGMKVK